MKPSLPGQRFSPSVQGLKGQSAVWNGHRHVHLRVLLVSMLSSDITRIFPAFMQLLQVSVRLPCDLKLTKDLESIWAAPNDSEHVVQVYNVGSLDVQPRWRHSLQTKAEPFEI